MWNIDKKLLKLKEENKEIRTAIIGAGQMGKGLITQFLMIPGLRPTIVANRTVEKAFNIMVGCGVDENHIFVANTLEQANVAMELGKYVITPYPEIACQANLVDCVVEATGVPEIGGFVGTKAIENGKHIVMLNVECDVVIGPYLKRLAEKAGVIYTGSAGDEPGAAMELYSFAKAIGFEVLVIGKGKNNPIDLTCNPDTVREEAIKRGMNPKILSEFKDGTKTMVELACMSNATGFVPDIMGAHGLKSDVAGLSEKYRLKKDGGHLNRHGVVEYVDGISPGVFVTVYSDNPEYMFHLDYLKMGSGPIWTLYRPYHLCNLETPITIAKAMLDHESTIVPIDGLVSECIAKAKKDLAAGEYIDGIGGYTAHGSIATYTESKTNGYIPMGLLTEKAVVTRDIKAGEILTWDNVEVDKTTLIYKLRQEQNSIWS